MNSSVKFCVDSTLSTELARFKLSPSVHHILMGVCIANGLLSPVAVLGRACTRDNLEVLEPVHKLKHSDILVSYD